MQIEGGKFYQTRGGLKVGPMGKLDNELVGLPEHLEWIDPLGGLWSRNGTWAGCDRKADLVAEWKDAPIRVVTRKEIVDG